MLTLHGGAFAIGLLWLAKRHNNFSFFVARRQKKANASRALDRPAA